MKKLYMSALGCLLAMGAGAQGLNQVGKLDDAGIYDFFSIPAKYAATGENVMFSIEENDEGVNFNVYKQDFTIDRTIKLEAPTVFERVVIEKRELVIDEKVYQTDCTDYVDSPYDKGYKAFYVNNYCDNTTITDEYVYEWVEYARCSGVYGHPNEGNWDIIDKREFRDGILYVTVENSEQLSGFYFAEGTLSYYDYHNSFYYGEQEYIHWGAFFDSYLTFCNKKTTEAVFSQELVEEYINYAGNGPWPENIFGVNDGYGHSAYYYVERVETKPSGETYFYTNQYERIEDEVYPTVYFVWKDETITLYYAEYSWSFSGDWVESVEPNSYGFEWEDILICDVKVGGYIDEEDYFIATQTLFNNDAKWEFLRPIYEEVQGYVYEQDRDWDGEIDFRSVEYDNRVIAYEVVSEDGAVLVTVEVPECTYCNLAVITWGDAQYFAIGVNTEVLVEEGDHSYWREENMLEIYHIDKNAGSLKKVASTPAMRVSPSMANRNRVINVTLDGKMKGSEQTVTTTQSVKKQQDNMHLGPTVVRALMTNKAK